MDPNFLKYKIMVLILGDYSENGPGGGGRQIFVENVFQCPVSTRIIFPRLFIVMQHFSGMTGSFSTQLCWNQGPEAPDTWLSQK